MNKLYTIGENYLNIETLYKIIQNNTSIELSQGVKKKIKASRDYLDRQFKNDKSPIYGINTGFGSLYNVKIDIDKLKVLQENIVMSHACGMGDQVPKTIVKIILLLKIQSFSYGYSGVQLSTVERLVDMYNNDILPIVYTQGSLGASGDLAPLAHISLPLIGKGEVYFKGQRISGDALLEEMNWKKITLQSKEGLALLNGTQFMTAYGVYILIKSEKLSYLADLIGTISLEAFDGTKEPFSDLIHNIRPHIGQLKTANRILKFLEGSELIESKKEHVQDPYSFRCMPQVHGATKDALDYVRKTFETEINSVTDNPNIFVNENKIISGGNFHGQPLALALDFLAISLSELGNISERRTYQLISGTRGIPNFLISKPGLNSGFMITQYTAASIVNHNKQLSTPASVDSIVSSNGQEDHVSMGANAATKAYIVVENLKSLLAIELMNASQAISFRKPLRTSSFLESVLNSFRSDVPLIQDDRVMYTDLKNAVNFIENLEIDLQEIM